MKQLLLLLTLVTLFAEVFSSIALRCLKKYGKRREAFDAITFLKSEDSRGPRGKFEHTPYGLYWNSPDYHVNGIRQTDSEGYRSSSPTFLRKNNCDYLILVLGSSTTYSDHFSLDPETAWPARLQFMLNKELNIEELEFRVVNAGLNYATSAELLCHFIFRANYLKPDLIILDGPGNDYLPVAFGDQTTDYRNTRYSIYFNKRRWEPMLLKSYFFQLIYIFSVTSKNLISMEPPGFKLGYGHEQNLRLESNNAQILRNNIQMLLHIANGMNIPTVLIDFLRPSKQKMSEYFPQIVSGLSSFENRVSDIYKELASLNPGRVLHIARELFHEVDDIDFHDSSHLTIEGEIKKARKILEIIKASRIIPEKHSEREILDDESPNSSFT